MKHFKTGFAGALACVLLAACSSNTSVSTEDEEETQGGSSFTNPIVRNVEVMNVFNCRHTQSAVFWKKASEDLVDSKRHTFAPFGTNPQDCPLSTQAPFTIFFDNGTAYDVWTVRVSANCNQNGDDNIELEPGDCPKVDTFRVNGTSNGKTTEVRID